MSFRYAPTTTSTCSVSAGLVSPVGSALSGGAAGSAAAGSGGSAAASLTAPTPTTSAAIRQSASPHCIHAGFDEQPLTGPPCEPPCLQTPCGFASDAVRGPAR